MVRPILNKWHPGTAKPTYWFPTLFILGLVTALTLSIFGLWLPLMLYVFYFFILFLDALVKNRKLVVAVLAILATLIQFTGYGIGFFKSTMLLNFSNRNPEELFPKLFSLFLLCSFLVWFISNLSETYESRAYFTLNYRNLPDSLLLGKNSNSQIEAKLRTS